MNVLNYHENTQYLRWCDPPELYTAICTFSADLQWFFVILAYCYELSRTRLQSWSKVAMAPSETKAGLLPVPRAESSFSASIPSYLTKHKAFLFSLILRRIYHHVGEKGCLPSPIREAIKYLMRGVNHLNDTSLLCTERTSRLMGMILTISHGHFDLDIAFAWESGRGEDQ